MKPTGYFQSMPAAGYTGECVPAGCAGNPKFDPVYASKHNPFLNFTRIRHNDQALARLVPDSQLAGDIRANAAPNFALIVPDECHDMHGASGGLCGSGGSGSAAARDRALVRAADQYVSDTVSQLTSAPWWRRGRNAIVLTSDEADGDNSGCCGTEPGGGHVLTVVATSMGAYHLEDGTPYNHYSLLRTIQMAFNLGCLESTCDSSITPMVPLFAPSRASKNP
jgi:hypothetical protein